MSTQRPTTRIRSSLRVKTILFAGGILFALVLLLGVLTSTQLLSTFQKLQRFMLEQQIERFVAQLKQIGDLKILLIKEYAEWDEAYNYLDGTNPNFLQNYFEPGQNTTGEDLLVLFDLKREAVATRWLTATDDREASLSKENLDAIREGQFLDDDHVLGFAIYHAKPILLASGHVLHTDQRGPANGWLVYGRWLTTDSIADMIDLAGIRCTGIQVFNSLSEIDAKGPAFPSLISVGKTRPWIFLSPQNATTYQAKVVFPVLQSSQVISINLDIQMDVLDAAMAVRNRIIILALIGGVCLVGLPLLAFEWSVLRKITRLDREILSLAGQKTKDGQLSVEGNDEFARLSTSVNGLVAAERLATQSLEAQKDLLSGILNAASEGIYALKPVRDEKGTIVDMTFSLCNQASEKLLGRAPGDLNGRSFIAEFPSAVARNIFSTFTRVVETGQPETFEYQASAAFAHRWFHISATPWDDGIVVTLDEITERRQREVQLEEAKIEAETANRAKSEFLATMSHEIRTPLHGVIGFASLLGHRDLSDEDRELVQNIQASGKLLSALVTDVLDFSKIEAGKLVLDEQVVAFPWHIERIARAAALQARDKGLQFHYQIDPALPAQASVDLVRIEQVLGNLLGNALKFTEKGAIRFEAKASPPTGTGQQTVIFEVADSGPGIPEETEHKLFTPFTQGDSSLSRRHGGSGLGLVIIRRLCELMGGEVSFRRGVSEGSVFTATMIVNLPPQPISPAPSEKADPLGGEKADTFRSLRILIAEDNRLNQKLLIRMLHPFGCETVIARNGREAVAQAAESFFDGILMDVGMPEVDGLTATRMIRTQETPGQHPIIIALTAGVSEGERAACRDAGMDHFLGKPFSEEGLLAALRFIAKSRTI